MKNKFISSIVLLLFHSCLGAQILYRDICKVPCNKCVPNPMKVEYKADPVKQMVLRVIDDSNVEVFTDCKVLDKNNWTCDGYGFMKNYGKQYAANGTAYWSSSEPNPDLEKKYGKSYSCTFEKNIFGQYKLK